jgi:hypothetical protein
MFWIVADDMFQQLDTMYLTIGFLKATILVVRRMDIHHPQKRMHATSGRRLEGNIGAKYAKESKLE